MRAPILAIAACLTGMFFLPLNSVAADPQISPGEWKYKMKTKIRGLGIALPAVPTRFSSCITRNNPVMQTPEMDKAGCEILHKEAQGNRLTFTVRCEHGDSVTETNYENTYEEDRMEGTFSHVRTVSGKIETTATGTLTGVRLGECKTD